MLPLSHRQTKDAQHLLFIQLVQSLQIYCLLLIKAALWVGKLIHQVTIKAMKKDILSQTKYINMTALILPGKRFADMDLHAGQICQR